MMDEKKIDFVIFEKDYKFLEKEIHEFLPTYLNHLIEKNSLDSSNYRKNESPILRNIRRKNILWRSNPGGNPGEDNGLHADYLADKYKKVYHDGEELFVFDYDFSWELNHIKTSAIHRNTDGDLQVTTAAYLALADDQRIEHYKFLVCFVFGFNTFAKSFTVDLIPYETENYLIPLQTESEIESSLLQMFENARFSFSEREKYSTFYYTSWELLNLSTQIYRIDLFKIFKRIAQKDFSQLVTEEMVINLTHKDDYKREQARKNITHYQIHIPAFLKKFIAAMVLNNNQISKKEFNRLVLEYQQEVMMKEKADNCKREEVK